MRATLQEAPRSTIIPAAQASTARALAMLEALVAQGPHASAQLEIGGVLGEGGMGVVRAAEQVALGRAVAVKTLKADRRADPTAALELLREAWVTGSLEHPNVVPVHTLEVGADGVPTIVLKKVAGVEWHKLMHDDVARAARFPGSGDRLAWNLEILLAILDALRFAHARGIVHRDLKPSNVMIGDFGETYLLDWGIAVALADDGSGRMPLAAHATEMAGTPCYMAPEMLGVEPGDEPALSPRTDLYLAGAVLHEIIAGEPPHRGTTAAAIIASVMASEPALPEHAPAELAHICRTAMSADPAARFASAEAMQAALRSYLAHRGSASLAARADEQLAELLAVIARPLALPPDAVGDPDREDDALADAEGVRREQVYRLFGACRFGFHEALAVWRDNADATAGLARAIRAVATYELDHGDARAAVATLAELAASTPEDHALAARARAALEAARQQRAELERLRRQHDGTLGRRTRASLTGMLGLAFTVLPLASARWNLGFDDPRGLVLWPVGGLVVVCALIYWARNSMLRTSLFNRRIALTGIFLFATQIVLGLGNWAMGLPIASSQISMLFLWGTLTWMLAITLDRWLWPCAVGYSIAFLVAARAPEHREYILAAANLGFAINTLIRWRPSTIVMTPDERAQREREDRRWAMRRARRL